MWCEIYAMFDINSMIWPGTNIQKMEMCQRDIGIYVIFNIDSVQKLVLGGIMYLNGLLTR